jgi:hypothetical protein
MFLCIVPMWMFAILILESAGMKIHLAGIKTRCQRRNRWVKPSFPPCFPTFFPGSTRRVLSLIVKSNTHTLPYTHKLFSPSDDLKKFFRKLGSSPRQASLRPSSFQYHRLQEPDRGVPVCCRQGALPQIHYSSREWKELGNRAHAKQVPSLQTRSDCQRSSR